MTRRTGPSERVRQEVYDRAGNACERCGRTTGSFSIHHRLPRKAGGTRNPEINSPANLCLLCELCHLHVERFREESYAQGWLVHSWQDPAQIDLPHRSAA